MDKVSIITVGVLCIFINSGVLGQHSTDDTPTRDYDGRIVGGYNITIQDAPYQVYLLLLRGVDYYQCGGSIISNDTILTAAHCLTGISRVYIRAGSTYSDEGGQRYSSSTYVIHPRYNSTTSDYDVAVVKVLEGITIDGVNTRIVSLPQEGERIKVGTDVLLTGWGYTMENGQTSRNLMAVTVPTVSNEDCRQSYGEDAITRRMFCAGYPEGGKDSCQGDSGGPAVNDDTGVQIGIVSFGIGCARPDFPGVYTYVAAPRIRRFIRTFGGV